MYTGVNCLSLVTHETVVMTVDAVHEMENKLLKAIHAAQHQPYKYKNFKDMIIKEGAHDEYDEPGRSRPPNVIW